MSNHDLLRALLQKRKANLLPPLFDDGELDNDEPDNIMEALKKKQVEDQMLLDFDINSQNQ